MWNVPRICSGHVLMIWAEMWAQVTVPSTAGPGLTVAGPNELKDHSRQVSGLFWAWICHDTHTASSSLPHHTYSWFEIHRVKCKIPSGDLPKAHSESKIRAKPFSITDSHQNEYPFSWRLIFLLSKSTASDGIFQCCFHASNLNCNTFPLISCMFQQSGSTMAVWGQWC